ncbi:MAG: hypothetical protein E6Q97_08360 [Desulfurellales bacterium]|nr:MAG: hypothetical protein E6Q97_08360 [Desulfurellales bacterium]
MDKFMNTIKLLLQLLPAIIAAIKALEEALPMTGKGPEKLVVLREIISGSYENIEGAAVTFTELWPSIERTVKSLVDMLNRTGGWGK